MRESMKQQTQLRKNVATASEKRRAIAVLDGLRKAFPEAHTALAYHNPFELLISTILSAQCTDIRVNLVTKDLFKKYPSAAAFAQTDQGTLERDIHSTGFFRMKAKNIIGCSRALMEHFNGKVPSSMDQLVSLPGVGRKTANVILSEAFGINEGVVVDTHVQRLAQRLGFTLKADPGGIEEDLMTLVPRDRWCEVGLTLILHGRKICSARKALCPECMIAELCPSAFSLDAKSPRTQKQKKPKANKALRPTSRK